MPSPEVLRKISNTAGWFIFINLHPVVWTHSFSHCCSLCRVKNAEDRKSGAWWQSSIRNHSICYTPPKTNIVSENQWFVTCISYWNSPFLKGNMLILWGKKSISISCLSVCTGQVHLPFSDMEIAWIHGCGIQIFSLESSMSQGKNIWFNGNPCNSIL